MTTAAAPRRAEQPDRTKSSKKIIIEFPEPLLERTDLAAVELATDRSKLIRSAVENYLGDLDKEKLDHDLAEGYKANSSLALQVSARLSTLDGDE